MLLYKNSFYTWGSDIQQKLIFVSSKWQPQTQNGHRHSVRGHMTGCVSNWCVPQAQQLHFLKRFITFIKWMHDILVPGYGSRKIKYLTKVAYGTETFVRRENVQCRESTGTQEVRPDSHRSSPGLSVSSCSCSSALHCHQVTATVLRTWHVFFFPAEFPNSSSRHKTRQGGRPSHKWGAQRKSQLINRWYSEGLFVRQPAHTI